MIAYLIDLIGSFTGSGIFSYILFPIMALAFLATVPYIIRAFFRR